METVKFLRHLFELGAPQWRIDLAERAVLAKTILKIEPNETSLRLIELRESIFV